MQDLNDKVTGGNLSATEWNQVPSEIQNVIESLGITLSAGDLNQLGKAIAGYVANGNFYTDSGAANAYVLTTIGSKQSLTAYTDGDTFEFIASTPNTGASTVNVATLGVKNIKLRDGTDPAAGQIAGRTILKFDLANNRCELVQSGQTNIVVFSASGTYNPPAGVKGLEFTVSGAGGGAGGLDAQGAGTGGCSIGGAAGATGIIGVSNIESSYTVTVGAKGTGGAAGANTGTAGGLSSVVSVAINVSAPGGGGGGGVTASAGFLVAGPAGSTPVSTGADVNLAGGDSLGTTSQTGLPTFSHSGVSYWGGGLSAVVSSNGFNALVPGSGGGGAFDSGGAADRSGGDGADGIVVIKEFF